MFVRETISRRKGSADVTYLHLAHNTWDPERKMTQTKILKLPQRRINMPLLLQGKVAIVTGGSRGIGAAIALALAGAGAKVIIDYVRHQKHALKLVERIKKEG